ncbi:unnamed protein product, partial [Mesorhabditis spiculigera]
MTLRKDKRKRRRSSVSESQHADEKFSPQSDDRFSKVFDEDDDEAAPSRQENEPDVAGVKPEVKEEIEDDEDFVDPERKQHKSGVVYFSVIPPGFNVAKLTDEMNMYSKGCVGRIYLVPTRASEKFKTRTAPENNDRGSKKKRHLTYKEGWVEFSRKSVAKRLAKSLNGVEVQVKAKHPASGTMWLCKYLPGFKWIHLMEQMDYERKVSMQRMKVEITQAKKVAEHFATQVEKGAHLRKLEEKVLKKGGLWEKHQRDIEQRKSRAGKKKPKTDRQAAKDEDDLMKLIYAD